MPKKLPVPEIDKQWDDGHSIGTAWLTLASTYAQKAYRTAADHGRDARRIMMQSDIAGYIQSGQMTCLGIRTDRKVEFEKGPQIIPARFFNNVKALNWLEETLTVHGIRYEQLKISRFQLDELLIEIGANAQSSLLVETKNIQTENSPFYENQIERNRGGRPSFKNGIDEAFAEMKRLGKIDLTSASHKAICNFVADYFKKNAERFIRIPDNRTISSYISKARKLNN